MLNIKTQGEFMKNAVQSRLELKENTIRCHPRRFLSGIPTLFTTQSGGDSRLQISGMTPNLMGFTLIELLVVVLIIGILAAVALPQYQFAVKKAKITPYLMNMLQVIKAEELHYLETGEYTPYFDDLLIDFSHICGTIGGACSHAGGGNELYNCPDPVAFNIGAQSIEGGGGCEFSREDPLFLLTFCDSSVCRAGASDLRITVKYELISKKFSCQVNKGKANDPMSAKLCNYIMGIVSPSK